MNTVKEIQGQLLELIAAMVEKGVVTPDASLTITTEKYGIALRADYSTRPFDGEYMNIIYGTTPAKAIKNAANFIASIPDPEEQVTRAYLDKVANAVDFATENSIPDEYVTPLRGVTCAMTENLLTDKRKVSA